MEPVKEIYYLKNQHLKWNTLKFDNIKNEFNYYSRLGFKYPSYVGHVPNYPLSGINKNR